MAASRGTTTHGHAGRGHHTPEYRAWMAMKSRCYNPKTKHYNDYGGRGITICPAWLASFEAFLADVGFRPGPKYSLDRYPDNNGNYEPDNCRWATRKEQNRNRRDNHQITYNGITHCIIDWARLLGIGEATIHNRLRRKLPIDQVLDPDTSVNGEDVSSAKLTETDVILIRERRLAGEPLKSLSAEFGVSRSTISGIALRKTWKHLI